MFEALLMVQILGLYRPWVSQGYLIYCLVKCYAFNPIHHFGSSCILLSIVHERIMHTLNHIRTPGCTVPNTTLNKMQTPKPMMQIWMPSDPVMRMRDMLSYPSPPMHFLENKITRCACLFLLRKAVVHSTSQHSRQNLRCRGERGLAVRTKPSRNQGAPAPSEQRTVVQDPRWRCSFCSFGGAVLKKRSGGPEKDRKSKQRTNVHDPGLRRGCRLLLFSL